MTMQQYCLRWNNHQPNFISVFSSLLNSESLVDVTLAAEGRHVQAHKVVLSACSSYFQSLFTINPCQHPIVILKDVKFADLKVMVDFMYYGEVNVSQEQLPYILKTAEMLKIKGLAEIPVDQSVSRSAQNNSSDKAELLTPGDSNWSTGDPRQSLSPLSPNSKRKRLRKSSTGSTERGTSDEQQSGEVTLTASSVLGTVIKSDPGSYGTENSGSILQKSKGHSSDSDLHRGSSHESVEGEITHQVTLQVPQEVNIHHSLEQGNSAEMSGPSSSGQPQLTVTGMQWNVMDHTAYAQFTSCTSTPSPSANANGSSQLPPTNHSSYCPPPPLPLPPPPPSSNQQQQQHNISQPHHPSSPHPSTLNSPPNTTPQCYQIANSPPQMMQKRKRSINPQGDENFIRALEAVRFGGIGFCKAARMYGVNNRTLWLEYKKRGYPNFRLSIKHRKQESVIQNEPQHQPQGQQQHHSQHQQQQQQQQTSQQQQQQSHQTPTHSPQNDQTIENKSEVLCNSSSSGGTTTTAQNHPVALISSAFFDSKHVDLGSVLPRPKYLDAAIINAQQGVNFQGINFEQM